VLINNLDDIPRAAEYAERVNIAEVWSKLGHAYLDQYKIGEAIECYLKGKDSS